MNFFRRWNTTIQLAVLMAALVLISSFAVGWATYQRLTTDLVQAELGQMHLEAQAAAQHFDSLINGMRADTKFLSATPPPQGYFRALANGGVDPVDGTSDQQAWITRLETIFRQFMLANPDYTQVRFLVREPNWSELLRVEKKAGQIVRIRDEELQQKGDRYYLQEFMQQDREDEVYVSRVDLNQENGSIVIPPQPVLRAVAGVALTEGDRPLGAIVINLEFDSYVDQVRVHLPSGRNFFVADETGNFIVHPDPARRFGGKRKHGFRMQDQWAASRDFSGQDVLPESFIFKNPDGVSQAIGVAALRQNGPQSGPGNTFFLSGDLDVIVPALAAIRAQVMLAAIILTVLAILAAILLSRLFTRRLRLLAESAQAVASGDYDLSLTDPGRDDVSQLANAISYMSSAVKEKIGQLEETEKKLQRRSDFLETVFADVPTMMFMKDAVELRFVRFNRAAEQITGFSADELIGKNDFDIFPEEEARSFSKIDRDVLRTNEVFIVGDETITCKDGSTRILHTRKVAIRDRDGIALSLLGMSEDVTEVRKMTADLAFNEKRFRTIVETAAEGVVTIDEQGQVLTFNEAASSMFDFAPGEVIGKNVSMLMPEPDRSRHDTYLHDYVKTGVSTVIGSGREVIGMRRDGTTFPMRLSIGVPIVGGQRTFAGIIHDLTAEKEHERQLVAARRLAEDANSAKSNFLATMSHELRTPLNAIIGYSEMLAEDVEQDEEMPDLASDLGKIRSAGRQLLGLINDVLDLSKIEAGSSEVEAATFSLRELIGEVADTVRRLVTKNGNTFEVSIDDGEDDEVNTDATLLRQILLNLLSNAAKFTSNGSVQLCVRIVADQAAGERNIVIEVRDTGIGIASHNIERIFEPFSQADTSTTRKFGGTGLGLTITRRICALMGGHIGVSSTEGEGTTFTAFLPVNLNSKDTGPVRPDTRLVAPTSKAARSRSNVILIIDDDAPSRALMANQLHRLGYETAEAASGIEGLQMARQLGPSAIILDIMMPELDGWSVLRLLKDDAALADIPVVLCTIVNDRHRGFALGAADYLLKPVSRDQLRSTLSRYCGDPPCKLLIVEDDVPTRGLYSRAAQNFGWHVVEAGTGREALTALEQSIPDLILLDLMMPDIDGFELVEALQATLAWRNIPVVIVTARDLTSDDIKRLNGHVERIIAKADRDVDGFARYISAKLAEFCPTEK